MKLKTAVVRPGLRLAGDGLLVGDGLRVARVLVEGLIVRGLRRRGLGGCRESIGPGGSGRALLDGGPGAGTGAAGAILPVLGLITAVRRGLAAAAHVCPGAGAEHEHATACTGY